MVQVVEPSLSTHVGDQDGIPDFDLVQSSLLREWGIGG